MSTHLFRVDEHVSPCQHIREYPRATAHTQEDVLELAIKQYTPLDNLSPRAGDITIIAAHANGFPKVNHRISKRQSEEADIADRRNSMSRFGMSCLLGQRPTDSVSEAFGSQM